MKIAKLALALTLLLGASTFVGCDNNDGPAEKAGKAVDNAGENAKDAVNNAADNVKDATN